MLSPMIESLLTPSAPLGLLLSHAGCDMLTGAPPNHADCSPGTLPPLAAAGCTGGRACVSMAAPGNATHAGCTTVRREGRTRMHCIDGMLTALGMLPQRAPPSKACSTLGHAPPSTAQGSPGVCSPRYGMGCSPSPFERPSSPPIANAALRQRCAEDARWQHAPLTGECNVLRSRSRSALGKASGRAGRLRPDVWPPRWASARAHSFARCSLRSNDFVDEVVGDCANRRKVSAARVNRRKPLAD